MACRCSKVVAQKSFLDMIPRTGRDAKTRRPDLVLNVERVEKIKKHRREVTLRLDAVELA